MPRCEATITVFVPNGEPGIDNRIREAVDRVGKIARGGEPEFRPREQALAGGIAVTVHCVLDTGLPPPAARSMLARELRMRFPTAVMDSVVEMTCA